ncbi:zinc ABC transporter substrate-binding protein [Bacteroidales bacterium OttesenSCG-928-M11]|nr:zinc ABC transporter substrate-binding protein [Bacteroidales bacterium OttesenSCG-928-M11]
MKRLSIGICLFLLIFNYACSPKPKEDKRIIITVTIEPQRYFAERLVDDSIFVIKTMVAPGVSPETYDPTPNQLTELAKSRAYFGIGQIGFEQTWMSRLKVNNPRVYFFDNSEGFNFIEAEHQCHDNHIHEGTDPHIWSSPSGALKIIENMRNALIKIEANPVNLENRYTELCNEIKKTDQLIRSLLDKTSQKEFIIYHPALSYFAHDYGLKQHVIEIEGKEPSVNQIRELIRTAKEKNIKTVFIQEEFDKKNAELIAKEVGCKLVVINPLSYNWKEEMIRIAQSLADE